MNAILEEKSKQQPLLGESELSNEQVKKLFKQIDQTSPTAPTEVRPYVPDFEVRAAPGCEVEIVRIPRHSYVLARQYTHMSRGKSEQQQAGLAAQFLTSATGSGELPGAGAAAASMSMSTLDALNSAGGTIISALDRGRRFSRPAPAAIEAALIQIDPREQNSLNANATIAPGAFSLGPKSRSAAGRVSISSGARANAPDQLEMRDATQSTSNPKVSPNKVFIFMYTY